MAEKDDICFLINEQKNFNFRVAAFIHCNNKVFLHTSKNKKEHWNMVGGRVKFNENTDQAIKRELKEELGFDFENVALRAICQNFFVYEGRRVTELLFIYDLQIEPEHPLAKIDRFEDYKMQYVWFEKQNVVPEKLFCLPKIIYEMASKPDWTLEHRIVN
jgi:8-oxo-dGTP pyrophosphatase MutT (NUDIX family)